MNEVERELALHVSRRVSDEALLRRTDIHEPAVGADQTDHVGCIFDERTEMSLAREHARRRVADLLRHRVERDTEPSDLVLARQSDPPAVVAAREILGRMRELTQWCRDASAEKPCTECTEQNDRERERPDAEEKAPGGCDDVGARLMDHDDPWRLPDGACRPEGLLAPRRGEA
jgi:hypothetical protein